jgi:hypothetical protein
MFGGRPKGQMFSLMMLNFAAQHVVELKLLTNNQMTNNCTWNNSIKQKLLTDKHETTTIHEMNQWSKGSSLTDRRPTDQQMK